MNIKTALLAVMLIACTTNPLDTKLRPDIEEWKEDTHLKEAIAKLDEEDKEAFGSYAIRYLLTQNFGGDPGPLAGTIREAVSSQRDFQERKAAEEAAAEALAKKQRQENEAKLERLRAAVTVGLVDKGFKKANHRQGTFRDHITFTLVFRNNTDQDIEGVKGHVVFTNMFGDEIKAIRLAHDDGIKANTHVEWRGESPYNQFKSSDKELVAADQEKIKMLWVPEVILFSNGKKLE